MSEPADPRLRQSFDNWRKRAPVWDDWADRIEKLARGLNAPLLEAAGLAPGQTVLDLASGAGEPALSLARAVGPDGRVTATDLVPEMLQGARRRAEAQGCDNIRFEVADMQALPFPDAAFDRVTCRLGLMYAPDADKALREARRVLKPGGRAVYVVWGPQENNTQFLVSDSVLEEVLGLDPHEGGFEPTRFAAPGSLTGPLRQAGFAEAEEIEFQRQPELDPDSGFWRSQVEMRVGEDFQALSAADRERLDAAMREAFEAYRVDDRIRLSVHARLAVATA